MHGQNGDSDPNGEALPARHSDGADAVARAELADLEERLATLKKRERRDLFWAVMGASPGALILAVPFLLGDAVLLITMALVAACALQWIRTFKTMEEVRAVEDEVGQARARIRLPHPPADGSTTLNDDPDDL